MTFEEFLTQAIGAAPEFPKAFIDWWVNAAQDGDSGPATSFSIGLAVVVFAMLFDRGVAWICNRRFEPSSSRDAASRVLAALRWAFGRSFSLIVFYFVARALLVLLLPDDSAQRLIGNLIVESALTVRIVLSVVDLFAARGAPERQAVGLTAEESDHLALCARDLVLLSIPLIFCRELIVLMLAPQPTMFFPTLLLSFLWSIITIMFFYRVRRPIARIIGETLTTENPTLLATIAAHYWHVVLATLIVISDSLTLGDEIGITAGRGTGAIAGYVFILAPLLIAAVPVLADRFRQSVENRWHSLIAGLSALVQGGIVCVAAVILLASWDINAFAVDAQGLERIVGSVVTALLVVVCGISVWRSAVFALDVYAPSAEDPSMLPSEYGTPVVASSRFATFYPVFRGFVLISVAVLTVMMALSALGADIGPLIAGAGVIGIAVGFGAQTLVKDIISGGFYLHEDAFRIGEYISTAEGKGVVEHISLRSARLRHHRGQIYTIPFGSMGTIENHSRDWVKIKFSFRVARTEDLERVRKLVKKVGTALAAEPELAGKFLEPLKSQGAIGMEGPDYVIGVKFTCRPGEQFLIRRKAYVALQKAFKDQDIKPPQPTVVVSQSTDVAAAAAAVIVSEEQKTAGQ